MSKTILKIMLHTTLFLLLVWCGIQSAECQTTGGTIQPPPTKILQNAQGGAGNGTTLGVRIYGGVVLQVAGTFTGTVNFEGTVDGSTWSSLNGVNLSSQAQATSATAAGLWFVPTPGIEQFRTRLSSMSSGVVTVTARPVPSVALGSPTSTGTGGGSGGAVAGDVAHDAVDSGNPIKVGGRASTTTPTSVADGDRVNAWFGLDGGQYVHLADRLDSTNDSIGVVGTVASGATDSGNPIKTGGVAVSSFPTAVTTGQRVNAFYDLNGRLVTAPYSNPENLVSGVTAAITGTGDTQVIAAAGASVRNYVTSLTIINSHASVDTVVELKDGTTVIWRGWAAHAGGGFAITFPAPLRGTANTAINCAAVTTGANVYCSAAGFKAP